MRGPFISLLLAAGFWGGATLASPDADAYRTERQELFYYPSGRFLKEVVLGYDQAASALAWLRTVQYYGQHARSDRTFDMMYHLCDITTELDPHFEEPYTFGAFVLMTEGKRPRSGMDLLRKGRENNPRSWKLLFETGFTYYISWEDYEQAAHYFTEAARIPEAPEYTRRFAAFVTQRAGEIETSILLWQELAERTSNPELREKALMKVEELTAELRGRSP
jgi:hypothetical protein